MAAITRISESCVETVTRTRWCRDMKLHLANLLHLVSSLLILRLGYIKLINILSLQRWEHNWWWHLQNIWIRNLQQLPTRYNRGNIPNLIHEFQLQEWILSEVDTKCCAPLPLPAGGIQIRLLDIYTFRYYCFRIATSVFMLPQLFCHHLTSEVLIQFMCMC